MTDPTGPGSSSSQVLRGGSWYGNYLDYDLRCATRYSGYSPPLTAYHVGFRCARSQ